MADNFTITRMDKTPEGYSIWEVTRKVIKEKYYPNRHDVAEALINGRDRTAFNRLVVKIRELNNLPDKSEYILGRDSVIRIPTYSEFVELVPLSVLHDTKAPTIEAVNNTEQKKGTILLFRGHSAKNTARPEEISIIISVFNSIRPELINRGYIIEIDPQVNYPNDDFGIPARQSLIMSKENKVDIFIEIHANAREKKENGKLVADQTVSGCEVYYPQKMINNTKSVFLAKSIVDAINKEMLGKATIKEDSQSKDGVITVLGGEGSPKSERHNIPAILFETGYYTNKVEFALMNDITYINKLVFLVCNGIDDYFVRYPTMVNK
jgi:N-acetylmuramoyl-L-alanine amidase